MRRRITGCSNNNRRTNNRRTNNRTNNIRTNNGCSHKRKNLKRYTKKRRGGTVNPIVELGTMFGTISNSIQSAMSSFYVPPATAYNPSLPISISPSSQYINNQLTQPISTIYKSV